MLEGGDVLDAADLAGPMTLRGQRRPGGALAGRVGSVKLKLTGGLTAAKTESGAPYSLFGDDNGDYLGGKSFAPGSYRFEVDVYSGAGGKGTLLDSYDFDFTVAPDQLLV